MKLRANSFNAAFKYKIRVACTEAVLAAVKQNKDRELPALAPAKGQAYVKNRRGKEILRVDYETFRKPSFMFWYESRTDITPMVTEALFGDINNG